MSRRFQVLLHGTGFSVPGRDNFIGGFYTNRRVLAENPKDAEQRAIAALHQEEKFRQLIEATERELGSRNECKIRMLEIAHLSWFQWHFTKCSPSFSFYTDEEAT